MRCTSLFIGVVFVICLFLAGCGTLPPREVHSGVGILRETLLDATPHGADPQNFTLGGSISRGTGSIDTGKPEGSTNISADLEAHVGKTIALGLQPYFSLVDGSLDARSLIAVATYARWRFADAARWTFSLYPGLSYGENEAEDHGQTCIFLDCVDTNQVSKGQVSAFDASLGIISSYYVTEQDALSLIPTVSLTSLKASYSVANETKFSQSKSIPNYSFSVAYGHVFELGANDALVQFNAGFATEEGFGTASPSIQFFPLAQASFRISLGGRRK